MPKGNCFLCKTESDIQLSHVVPSFVYRWLRDSSGNGFMRNSSAPNLRVQDGPQEYWLCGECEGRFNFAETAFANHLFYPYLAASGQQLRYGSWLLQFCTSVSWRALLYHLRRGAGGGFAPEALSQIERAEAAWRAFLLGQVPHPGVYRQHLLPLDEIKSATPKLPPNINRYLMRAIDIDLCHGEKTIFVYSKLGRFVILGFINEPTPNKWVGTKINANHGTVDPRHYTLPAPFWNYIIGKANSIAEAMAKISEKQQRKIDQSFRSNVDRIIGSDFFRAMQADVEMFGSDAFISNTSEKRKPVGSLSGQALKI